MFFVFILQSSVTGRYYVGSTSVLDDRLTRHNSGRSKATKHGIPWALVHTECFPSREEAVRREREIKSPTSDLADCLSKHNYGRLKAIEQGTPNLGARRSQAFDLSPLKPGEIQVKLDLLVS